MDFETAARALLCSNLFILSITCFSFLEDQSSFENPQLINLTLGGTDLSHHLQRENHLPPIPLGG